MAKTRNYRDSLRESLKDPKEAEAYLNASLEENVTWRRRGVECRSSPRRPG